MNKKWKGWAMVGTIVLYQIFAATGTSTVLSRDVEAADVLSLLSMDTMLTERNAGELRNYIEGLDDSDTKTLAAVLEKLNRKIRKDMGALEELMDRLTRLIGNDFAQRTAGFQKSQFDLCFRKFAELKQSQARRDVLSSKHRSDYLPQDYWDQIQDGLGFLIGKGPQMSIVQMWETIEDTLKGPYPLWNDKYQDIRAYLYNLRKDSDINVFSPLGHEENKFRDDFVDFQAVLRRIASASSKNF